MPLTLIQAVDERLMPFPAEQIWSVLADARSFPNWSPSSVKVRVLEAMPGIVGTRYELHPRGGRAFQCQVEAVDAPRRMGIRYPGEFIVGTGEWRLESVGSDRTRVAYAMDVSATGWLVALLGRVLPLARIHSKAMQDILEALERETARRGGQ